MKVFIASKGESCEGSRIIGVYANHADAVAAALAHPAYFQDGKWRATEPNIPDYWENGCDYVIVTEWDVQP